MKNSDDIASPRMPSLNNLDNKCMNRRSALGIGAGLLASPLLGVQAKSTRDYDAIIIGAGLSGLHTAMILEDQGLKVLTLEGRERIGGRVYTLMDIPGKPEAAGELIGSNYARMISTARSLDIELIEPNRLGAGEKLYSIRGQTFTADEWPDHQLNPLKGEDRKILPDRLLFTLSNRNNPLLGKPLDDWIRPEYKKYDIPQSKYLRDYLGLNEETIRLMNVVVHTDHMDNTSALHECRRYAVGSFNRSSSLGKKQQSSSLQVKGGNSLLPLAMANSLKNGVLTNKSVYGINDEGGFVEVKCSDGTSYKAKQVVCSIPYPVMRDILFHPRMPNRMRQAISEIDYGISIQVHFLIKRKFWEEDGLPANMWSDAPFERFAVLNRGKGGAPSSAIAFINGNEAFKYNLMNDQQVAEYTTQELIKVRPSIRGALQPVLVQSCHRNVHGAGDWVFWRPGQVSAYAPFMRERHGNIHFCGEHTALLERGMEGAFESGERAALDLLART